MKLTSAYSVSAAPLLLALLLPFSGCSSRDNRFKDLRLPTLSGSEMVRLGQCPTPKCLTVVVAPWCGYCRASTGMVLALRDHLKGKGIATRIVVGQDGVEPVREYAAEFGPDALLDPPGNLSVSGVPNFIVSDSSGQILQSKGGVPQGLGPPWGPQVLDLIASLYGL